MYKHGIDCIEKADTILSGKRVGLITNYTALNHEFKRTADILYKRYNLVRLYAPEHGLNGVYQDGVNVDDMIDEITGLPVYSLFKESFSIDLQGIDVVAYDIQDLNLRFYTHTSFMALAMKECSKQKIPFVIFDRYNPLGLEKVSGTVLNEKYSSLCGMYSVPSRYGLTVGEYAKYINTEKNINCELYVIPCSGLNRADSFLTLDTGWVNPSPNIPTFDTALVYCGTVLFEGTNVSEGRGTTKPFEFIGAPWINSNELADAMNNKNLPGVYFRPLSFVPVSSKYSGECCNGVQLHITDYSAFEPFSCGLYLVDEIRQTYTEFKTTDFLKNLLGDDGFEKADFDVDLYIKEHKVKLCEFCKRAEKYYLYK